MEAEQKNPARILAIAGSDSGGGAGIQADIKTITALGGYAMTALTALTAQNTEGVQAILPVPPEFLRQQIRSVLDDLGADAIKTGMLGGAAEIQCVCEEISRYRSIVSDLPVVVDPVMVAKGGASLLAEEALLCLKTQLFPLATVLTPNLPEAEKLTGMILSSVDDMRRAAQILREMSGAAVLVKGGHLSGNTLIDVLLDDGGFTEFSD
ncbi:MAG: bifunctional hydroxymethylpyrimidine kinase/phosphomethylpyrimidine kinase, partial [Acetobacter malorum]